MSADESFLARWAHRKHAVATNPRAQPKPEDEEDQASAEVASACAPAEESESLADPKNLPPIETISAGSDIRPFLAKGVPADLTRAALRRAWSADPAIRDFVGLAENSWDFNAPGGVPGFGALTMEDARRLLTRVTKETEALGPAYPAAERLADDQAPASAGQSQKTTGSEQVEPGADTDQHKREERNPRRLLRRRRHGGALPD